MRVPSITPGQVAERAAESRAALQRLVQAAPRVLDLLDAAQTVIARLLIVIGRIEDDEHAARLLIARIDGTAQLAEVVAESAARTFVRIDALLDAYEPALLKVRPAITRAADGLGPVEVDALVTVLDDAPELIGRIERDVLPVLHTLRTVAPDLTDLLASSRTLNEMLGSLPGLGRIKKRVDEDLADRTDG